MLTTNSDVDVKIRRADTAENQAQIAQITKFCLRTDFLLCSKVFFIALFFASTVFFCRSPFFIESFLSIYVPFVFICTIVLNFGWLS